MLVLIQLVYIPSRHNIYMIQTSHVKTHHFSSVYRTEQLYLLDYKSKDFENTIKRFTNRNWSIQFSIRWNWKCFQMAVSFYYIHDWCLTLAKSWKKAYMDIFTVFSSQKLRMSLGIQVHDIKSDKHDLTISNISTYLKSTSLIL